MLEVARIYRFRARDPLPDLPAPWCHEHEHDYTVEVVACGAGPVVVDTDQLDHAWEGQQNALCGNLNEVFADTTVESIATGLLADLQFAVPEVYQVTVREDDQRWGRATA